MFTNLGPGSYRVREVNQMNWVRMTNNPADVVAVSGRNVTQAGFGNAPAASLLPPSKRFLVSNNLVNLRNGVFAAQVNFVANLYETLLGRAPDLAGLRRYVQMLQAGCSQQMVAAAFKADYHL
jgi:hypothetical protein